LIAFDGSRSSWIAGAHAQSPPQGSSVLPPVTVEAPRAQRRPRAAQPSRRADRAAGPRSRQRQAQERAAEATPAGERGNPKAAPGGFVSSEAGLGMLGNRSILEAPFSITGFTEQFIKDRQASTAKDVLQNDPAVNYTGTVGYFADQFTVRGFPIAQFGSFLYDGQSVGTLSKFGIELVDRIDVLKGPGAALYGIPAFPSVGGVINYVPKRPLDYDYNSITARWVQPESFGAHFDVSRRYGDKREFGIRVNGNYTDGEVWPSTRVQHPAGSVSLDWKPTDRLRMYLDVLYTANFNKRDQLPFQVAPGVPIPPAPSAKVNYLQPWNYTNNPFALAFFKTEYDLAADWKFDATYRHSYLGYDFLAVSPTITDAAGGYSERPFFRDKQHYDVFGGQANVRGKFYAAGFKHEPTFGVDAEDHKIFQTPTFFPLGGATQLASNLANPVYIPKPMLPSLVERKQLNTRITTAYANDVITLPGEYVQVIGGVRHITLEQLSFSNVTGALTNDYEGAKFLPVYSVLIHPTKSLSFYGSYSQGFEAGGIAGPTANNPGQVLGPISSEQYEAGAKIQMFGMLATIAGFQLSRNSQYLDPVTNIFGEFGVQTHTGVEASVTGEPIKGTRFILGGMAFDAVSKNTGNPATEGKVPIGVSRTQANLYIEQDVPWISGFSINGGLYYAGPQFFDATNERQIAGWTRLDLGVRYRTLLQNKYTLTTRFNVENIEDKRYWISTIGGLGLAQPRTYKVSAQLQW